MRVIKSIMMRRVGQVAYLGKRKGAYRVLGEKADGKTPLGRPKHRWEDNITLDLNEVGLEGVG
jgi:hypothetical protein